VAKTTTIKSKIIGREKELSQIRQAIELSRNLLVEGPVGVGKTFLIQQVLKDLGKTFERIDGDTRYTEQKLTGWFDPPLVLKKGYVESCFVDGPLATAMKKGKTLFINELNRMPEAVQNILLPAMDEKQITLPKLGNIEAKAGFNVIATQNPREFTATHALSEALLDRFEMIRLDYLTRDEEVEILKQEIGGLKGDILEKAVDLIRATRNHNAIKRGASIRAAIAICSLVAGGMDYETACLMALPSRIELVSSEDDPLKLIQDLLSLTDLPSSKEKKK
jgi:gas vesicle protein GvpN